MTDPQLHEISVQIGLGVQDLLETIQASPNIAGRSGTVVAGILGQTVAIVAERSSNPDIFIQMAAVMTSTVRANFKERTDGASA